MTASNKETLPSKTSKQLLESARDALRNAGTVTRNLVAGWIDEYLARPTDETCDAPSSAFRDVINERARQVAKEGWTREHDDEHQHRELARAAGAYVQHYYERQWLIAHGEPEAYRNDAAPDCWPWAPEWWKPKDVRRDLIRAGALILAEIERLDRHSEKANAAPGEGCGCSMPYYKICNPENGSEQRMTPAYDIDKGPPSSEG